MKRDPVRGKVYDEIQKAIRSGILPPASTMTCEMCGVNRGMVPGIKMGYHHEDYDKPLEVTALCMKCHRKVHAKPKKIKEKKPRKARPLNPNTYRPTPRNPRHEDNKMLIVSDN